MLDPYLQFASAEEEEAYRKREQERKDAYDRELAKQTLDGNSKAAKIAQEQLRDAGAHGADRSRDFAGMVQRADSAVADLQSARQQPETASERQTVDANKSAQPAPASDDLGDIFATLKAAGVTTPAIQAREAGHGVALAASDGSQKLSSGRS